MQNNGIYSLLISVGDYRKINMENLSTYKSDVMLMIEALSSGLKIPKENIRRMIGEDETGFVGVTEFAKVMTKFAKLLKSGDTFILYYSGHGVEDDLIFSDGQIKLQSIIDFVGKMPSKNKIVIFDCCYSGGFVTDGARKMNFEQTVSEFAGHGIVVIASSAANEVSRLSEDGTHSIFTKALATAMITGKHKKKGVISIDNINDEARAIIRDWNRNNPRKEQHPIFRSNIGGTISFTIEEYKEYKQKEIAYETDEYRVVKVKPLSSGSIKRLSAFVIIKEDGKLENLAEYTKKIAKKIKYVNVYSNEKSEKKFGISGAKAVWCYFGYDEEDIVNHLHYAYTIWAVNSKMRDLYFKENKHAVIIDNIYVYENSSYAMLKRMQQPTVSRQEFIEQNKKLLSTLVSLAEEYIYDLHEVVNGLLDIKTMQKRYTNWMLLIKKYYIQFSDVDIAPNDLHDWSEEIVNLAGWVLDLSLILENKSENGVIGEREIWLINNAKGHYNESLEKLKGLEKY